MASGGAYLGSTRAGSTATESVDYTRCGLSARAPAEASDEDRSARMEPSRWHALTRINTWSKHLTWVNNIWVNKFAVKKLVKMRATWRIRRAHGPCLNFQIKAVLRRTRRAVQFGDMTAQWRPHFSERRSMKLVQPGMQFDEPGCSEPLI